MPVPDSRRTPLLAVATVAFAATSLIAGGCTTSPNTDPRTAWCDAHPALIQATLDAYGDQSVASRLEACRVMYAAEGPQ
jgi:hypothetical protein